MVVRAGNPVPVMGGNIPGPLRKLPSGKPNP
jgi:hypothetical protein